MADIHKLSNEIGIRELALSSGRFTENDESLLVLGNKPENLKNKEIYLRYANERDWELSRPEAFYAEAGVFNQREFRSFQSQLAQEGWSFTVHSDPDGNKTSKKYYVRIQNDKSDQVYVGIPVTKAHFTAGLDPVLDDLLIIDERSFLDNPNFAMSLNHKRIKVEANDGRWIVAKNEPLAGRIELSGKTIEANNPEEIYLLTEAEIKQYNSDGARKGWLEDQTEKKDGAKLKSDLRTFVKKEWKNGINETVDRRFAKEIMIPQMVNGEKTLVKHYLLSDQKTLESLEIMAPTLKEEESIIQEDAVDEEPETKLTDDEVARLTEHQKNFDINDPGIHDVDEYRDGPDGGFQTGESEPAPKDQQKAESATQPEAKPKAESKTQPEAEPKAKPSSEPKAELTGIALEIANRIRSANNGTLSVPEKAFLDDLNAIQDDPVKLQEAFSSIQNSPEHSNIVRQLQRESKNDSGKKPSSVNSNEPATGSTNPATKTVNGVEAAAGAVAGLVGGVVNGATSIAGAAVNGATSVAGAVVNGATAIVGGVADLATGSLAEVKTIIENHQKRKQYRLDHPEVVAQENAAKKERLMVTRRAVAEDSNRILDAKIESVIASKKYIDQNPAVQQMHQMIDDNPTLKNKLEEWLQDVAEGNPVFAEHLDNVKNNAGGVARSMEENLKLNNLAEGDIQERKARFERFNENFANDSLADVLPDKGVATPDGEQPVTIRESITKAINNMMKMLKDMMLRLLGKKKALQGESAVQRESVGQDDDIAPAMSR